jgi:Holliday junction resolvase RusA-like endonuclease
VTRRPEAVGLAPLELTFLRLRPRSQFGLRGLLPSAPALPAVMPDADKLFRSVGDALSGIAYRDDAQITTAVVRKRFGAVAGVEVAISADDAAEVVQAPVGTLPLFAGTRP